MEATKTTRVSEGKSSGSYRTGLRREKGSDREERRVRRRWARVWEVAVWERKKTLGLGLGFWGDLRRRDL